MQKDKNIINSRMKLLQKDYERASRLLGDIIEGDSDVIKEICCYIQQYGINSLFQNVQYFNFARDVTEKLNAVGMVLYGINDESLQGGASYEKDIY